MAKSDKHRHPILAEIIDWTRTIAITLLAALLIQRFVFTLARVDGPSMQDTLHSEQLMAVMRISYLLRAPERGEVVLCQYPDMPDMCVKRVIALPGESVRIENSVVYIDGIPLDEPYLTLPDTWDFAETVVEEGHYFVLGDHRDISKDSRSVGALPLDSIAGHCVAILWPAGEWKIIE